jgi:D-alanyl-D-alanine carboxypeptidase (penicillin-binding protein 5/6)
MRTSFMASAAFAAVLLFRSSLSASALEVVARNPYAGAVVIDAATGKVLFQDGADVRAYPASITKLMTLLVILDAIDAHCLRLDEPVTVTPKASRIGGSQVYLKDNEVFPVEELLYALMIESANDAAVALAIHYAGTKEAFVELMTRRAMEIGMRNTVFHSVHGLPPGRGQLPDVSTPRDIAKLCRELLKKRDVLKYTSTRRRAFRADAAEPFIMVNHNRLLCTAEGCDGLKTGYFRAAGFSIAATSTRGGKRVIAVVLGAREAKTRDREAKKILAEGLDKLLTAPAPPARAAAHQSAQ